jgi:hypothetical protein
MHDIYIYIASQDSQVENNVSTYHYYSPIQIEKSSDILSSIIIIIIIILEKDINWVSHVDV